jgi:hypothetical protein
MGNITLYNQQMEIMADFSCYPIIIPRKWGKKNRKKRVPKDVKSWSVFLGTSSGHWPPQITMITEQQYGHESFGFHTKISHNKKSKSATKSLPSQFLRHPSYCNSWIDPVLNHDFDWDSNIMERGNWSPRTRFQGGITHQFQGGHWIAKSINNQL